MDLWPNYDNWFGQFGPNIECRKLDLCNQSCSTDGIVLSNRDISLEKNHRVKLSIMSLYDLASL